MKCQILFSGKNKKNIINLSSAENAQRVVKVNSSSLKLRLRRGTKIACYSYKDQSHLLSACTDLRY